MHRGHERDGKKLTFLAIASADRYCELVADFQQYYGIDLTAVPLDAGCPEREIARMSILAAQLPPESRTKRAMSPLSAVTVGDRLLRQIEYNQRLYAYGRSEDAKNGVNMPEPVMFDGERELAERDAERAARMSSIVASGLGLDGLEAAHG